jgi:chaperonin GroES
MAIKFKPLGDRVVVKPQKKEEKSAGGILLTDSINRGEKVIGEVVAIGGGIFSQNGERIPMTVSIGDSVLYKKDMASETLPLDGEDYLLFHEHELLGIIPQ